MGHVLKFIEKLKADSTLQESWRFEDFVAFEKLRWQFYSKPGGDLYSYASDMVKLRRIILYAPKRALRAGIVCPQTSRELIQNDFSNSESIRI